MEIYNEIINDLLEPSSTNLKIREDTTSLGAYVQGLKAVRLTSHAHFTEIIKQGEKGRQYGKTLANEKYNDVYSSRSHTIIQIV
jgi:hypothetical protein